MKVCSVVFLALASLRGEVTGFAPSSTAGCSRKTMTPVPHLFSTPLSDPSMKEREVSRMVDDDEWDGVTMRITEAVYKSVMETVSTKAKTFVGGKEDDVVSVKDVALEVDARVKQIVANMRGKDKYEVGDLVSLATEQGIAVAEKVTGKKMEKYAELTKSIDTKVKDVVKSYTGVNGYGSDELGLAIAATVKTRVKGLAKQYELDQVANELRAKRKEWARKYLGEEFTEHFTWTQLANRITGKTEYHVGDVSKKVLEEASKVLGGMMNAKTTPTTAPAAASSAAEGGNGTTSTTKS